MNKQTILLIVYRDRPLIMIDDGRSRSTITNFVCLLIYNEMITIKIWPTAGVYLLHSFILSTAGA